MIFHKIVTVPYFLQGKVVGKGKANEALIKVLEDKSATAIISDDGETDSSQQTVIVNRKILDKAVSGETKTARKGEQLENLIIAGLGGLMGIAIKLGPNLSVKEYAMYFLAGAGAMTITMGMRKLLLPDTLFYKPVQNPQLINNL